MSTAERIGRQVLPILVCVGGVGILVRQLHQETLKPDNALLALLLCGLIAAGIQMCTVLFSSKHRSPAAGVCDATIIMATLAVLCVLPDFMEYVVRMETVTYEWYPGPQINSVGTCLAAAAIVVLAFFPKTTVASEPPMVEDSARVSVAERIGRQALPILACLWGLSFALAPQWFNGDFEDRAISALFLCGILAPWLQMTTVQFVGKHRKNRMITRDAALFLATVGILVLVPLFAETVLGARYTVYSLSVGRPLNVAAACASTAAVVALALLPLAPRCATSAKARS